MSETQWVQHNSGQGEKWMVRQQNNYAYESYPANGDLSQCVWLPKSEYVPCEKPTRRFIDVTEECEWNERKYVLIHRGGLVGDGHRLRKVKFYQCDPSSVTNREQWAFIVEREVPHG